MAPHYQAFLTLPGTVALGDWQLSKPLDPLDQRCPYGWARDQREALEGHLSFSDQLMLPLLAPAGGRAVPAAIYTLITYEAEGGALLRGGWAIPSATDIAFALGGADAAGSRAPLPLKVYLLALATLAVARRQQIDDGWLEPSRTTISAHCTASPNRPAIKWAWAATTVCMLNL